MNKDQKEGWNGALFMIGIVTAIAAIVVLSIREFYPSGDRAITFEGHAYVFIDPDHGCQYLTRDGGGYSPRLDKAGRHICKEQP